MKKDKKFKQYEKQINNKAPEVSTVIKITVGVIIFVALAYLLMAIITGNISFKKDKKEKVEIQTSEILAEKTFKQSEDEYYVFFYDMKKGNSLIKQIISTIGSTKTIYEVDLSKKFNTGYIANTANQNPNGLEDLKVTDPTLIKIVKGKSVKVVTGDSEISKYCLSI